MGKRDHLKDYVPTEDGGYEYVGTHWAWPSSERRTSFIHYARLLFAGAAAHAVAPARGLCDPIQ